MLVWRAVLTIVSMTLSTSSDIDSSLISRKLLWKRNWGKRVFRPLYKSKNCALRVRGLISNCRDLITGKYAISRCYLVSRRTTWTPKLANRRHARRHCSAELKPITRLLGWIRPGASGTVTPVTRRAFLRLLIGPRIKVSLRASDTARKVDGIDV